MLAMGRGLNISFMLGFQEVSGIWARLGEKTASLLGNANLTVAMRQQDAGRTKDWIERTTGQTYVTQATSYHGADDGNYREARQADVRPVSRVDWNDLTSLIEGEAIVLFGGRRIYAKMFHAQIDDSGPKRIGRSLMLRAPDPRTVAAEYARISQIADTIETDSLASAPGEPVSPALDAMVRGFVREARSGSSAHACAVGALAEIGRLPESDFDDKPAAPADGTPVTVLTTMLETASARKVPGPSTTGRPHEPIDDRLLRGIAALEEAAGASPAAGRRTAISTLAERDAALGAIRIVEPPAMSVGTLQQHLAAIERELVRLRTGAKASAQRQAA
jgi:intracellular multiplication protein IcmO